MVCAHQRQFLDEVAWENHMQFFRYTENDRKVDAFRDCLDKKNLLTFTAKIFQASIYGPVLLKRNFGKIHVS